MKYLVLLACLTFAGFFTGEIAKNKKATNLSQHIDITGNKKLNNEIKVEFLEFSPMIIKATK